MARTTAGPEWFVEPSFGQRIGGAVVETGGRELTVCHFHGPSGSGSEPLDVGSLARSIRLPTN